MKSLNLETLNVLGAVLPSIKEIENLTLKQREYQNWYWLRSPGITQSHAAYVSIDGLVSYGGLDVDYDDGCVRPALVIENLDSFNLKPRDQVEIEALPQRYSSYIVVNEHMLLANFDLGQYAFNEDPSKGNDYWTSDVKQVVDAWFEEHFEGNQI